MGGYFFSIQSSVKFRFCFSCENFPALYSFDLLRGMDKLFHSSLLRSFEMYTIWPT